MIFSFRHKYLHTTYIYMHLTAFYFFNNYMLIHLSDIILYRTFKTVIKLVLTDIVLIHFYQGLNSYYVNFKLKNLFLTI